MKCKILIGPVFVIGLLASSPAYAIDCKPMVDKAATAVEAASEAMKSIKEPGFKTRVRVLVDDAIMLSNSSKRLCGRENATRLTLARARAQAESAIAWAKAAEDLTAEYAKQ